MTLANVHSDRARIAQLEAQVAGLTEELEAWRRYGDLTERGSRDTERAVRVRARVIALKPPYRRMNYGGAVVRLLIHFLDNPDRVHSRETLLGVVGTDGSDSLPKIVDVRISQARDVLVWAGLPRTAIETAWGHGYRVAAASADLLRAHLEPVP